MVKKMTVVYLILVLLIILVGGGLVYFKTRPSQPEQPAVNQPTNNQEPTTSEPIADIIPAEKTDCTDELDTECWNTYNNKEFGFRFKYPRGWEVEKYDDYNGKVFYTLIFITNRTEIERFPFITIKSDWSVNKEIEEINNSGSQFEKVKAEDDITIGLFSAKQIIYSTEIGVDFQKTIINGPEQMLLIFDSYPDDNNFKKIISTLQFID